MYEIANKESHELEFITEVVNISNQRFADDKIIIGLIVVILIVVALEMRNPGFTVVFDSKGGTDVPAHNQMYGELLNVPEPPTREGYRFAGWHTDATCDTLWKVEVQTIETDMILYAGEAAA